MVIHLIFQNTVAGKGNLFSNKNTSSMPRKVWLPEFPEVTDVTSFFLTDTCYYLTPNVHRHFLYHPFTTTTNQHFTHPTTYAENYG